eukprot:479949-Prorocentrum_minimum.AAC.1
MEEEQRQAKAASQRAELERILKDESDRLLARQKPTTQAAVCVRDSVQIPCKFRAVGQRTDRTVEWTVTAVGKRTREAEQEAYRRCKTARQTDLRVMPAGPKGRAVEESGELDTG